MKWKEWNVPWISCFIWKWDMWKQFEGVRNHLQSPSPRIALNIVGVRTKYILMNSANVDPKKKLPCPFSHLLFPWAAVSTISKESKQNNNKIGNITNGISEHKAYLHLATDCKGRSRSLHYQRNSSSSDMNLRVASLSVNKNFYLWCCSIQM